MSIPANVTLTAGKFDMSNAVKRPWRLTTAFVIGLAVSVCLMILRVAQDQPLYDWSAPQAELVGAMMADFVFIPLLFVIVALIRNAVVRKKSRVA
jgi:hypothetical protein